ncbi:hypothetical protein QCA50_010865 [Cerrena zonata]|uniref:Peptidase A2 domain-containing protein n=1 Tax=Cerrena zonata TaxID=2478898 RepID=A0AAW0FYA7_9APHY
MLAPYLILYISSVLTEGVVNHIGFFNELPGDVSENDELMDIEVEISTQRQDLISTLEALVGLYDKKIIYQNCQIKCYADHLDFINGEIQRSDEKIALYTRNMEVLASQIVSDNLQVTSESSNSDTVIESDGSPPLCLPITCKEGGPVTRIGDVFAENAQRVLFEHGPYWETDEHDVDSLLVYAIEGRHYVIMHSDIEEDVLIDVELIQDSEFDLPSWYRLQVMEQFISTAVVPPLDIAHLRNTYIRETQRQLNSLLPWPRPIVEDSRWRPLRFECFSQSDRLLTIIDAYLKLTVFLPVALLQRPDFTLGNWYATAACRAMLETGIIESEKLYCDHNLFGDLHLMAAGPGAAPSISAVQRNSGTPRDFKHLIPEPAVVVVNINGQSARALIDSGSLADFMSAKLAHQLNIKAFELEKPLPVHLAVQGSRVKINLGCNAELSYQGIRSPQYFDIINLLNYDLILGTPFMFQHQVMLGFNLMTVSIGSAQALKIQGKHIRVLESWAADLFKDQLETT